MAEYTDHFACVLYVTPEELLACCKVANDNFEDDDPRLLDAIEDASLVLYYLTGRQFGGTCQTTVRPCVPCASCECSCGSCKPNQVNLGLWPVTDLISIRTEGETLSGAELAAAYHVDNYRYLVRNDGDRFPHGGNPYAIAGGAHDNDVDGYVFEVTVAHGLAVPRLLTRAARALACQFATACLDLPCKLPERVTSVSRQGVSMDVASAEDLLRDGRTGIYEVDLAIRVFNPSGLQSPSFVWSGQTPAGRRVNT